MGYTIQMAISIWKIGIQMAISIWKMGYGFITKFSGYPIFSQTMADVWFVYMLYICTTGITLGSNQLAMESGIKSHQMVWCEDGSPKCPKGLSEFSSLNGWYMLGIYPMFRHTHIWLIYDWYPTCFFGQERTPVVCLRKMMAMTGAFSERMEDVLYHVDSLESNHSKRWFNNQTWRDHHETKWTSSNHVQINWLGFWQILMIHVLCQRTGWFSDQPHGIP